MQINNEKEVNAKRHEQKEINNNLRDYGCGMGFSQKLIKVYCKQNGFATVIIDPKKEYIHANPF